MEEGSFILERSLWVEKTFLLETVEFFVSICIYGPLGCVLLKYIFKTTLKARLLGQ